MSKNKEKHSQKELANDPQAFVKALLDAINALDRKRTETLCDQLIEHLHIRSRPYPFSQSKTILEALWRKRHFDLLGSVADILLQTAKKDSKNPRKELLARRYYAQFLISQDYLSAALDVLKIQKQYCLDINDQSEYAETQGLIGRVLKQAYMNAASQGRPGAVHHKNLKRAIKAYAGLYADKKEHVWHGINTVALINRAKQDRVKLGAELPKLKSIAKEILERITAKNKTDLWDYATAGEACLAMKDYVRARDWILKYTHENPDADAFQYASTLRQFEEVWRLDEGIKEQAQILHLLREALLRKEGGQIEIGNSVQNLEVASELEADKQFEKILGKDRFKSFLWYRTGLDRASGVAQILNQFGEGQGSGFLVRGADIHNSIEQEWVVVTNAHVISDDPKEQRATPASLSSDEVRIRFEAKDLGEEYEVEDILFSSPRNELDVTIVSLKSPLDHASPFPIAKRPPVVGKNQRVYVIGHPGGRNLSFSMNDNLLLDHEAPWIHYRAPTEGGSSGSPVFNQNWDLIALHHAGGTEMKRLNEEKGTYPANEGILFSSIMEAIASKLG